MGLFGGQADIGLVGQEIRDGQADIGIAGQQEMKRLVWG